MCLLGFLKVWDWGECLPNEIKLVLKLLHTLALGHAGKKSYSEQGSAELVHWFVMGGGGGKCSPLPPLGYATACERYALRDVCRWVNCSNTGMVHWKKYIYKRKTIVQVTWVLAYPSTVSRVYNMPWHNSFYVWGYEGWGYEGSTNSSVKSAAVEICHSRSGSKGIPSQHLSLWLRQCCWDFFLPQLPKATHMPLQCVFWKLLYLQLLMAMQEGMPAFCLMKGPNVCTAGYWIANHTNYYNTSCIVLIRSWFTILSNNGCCYCTNRDSWWWIHTNLSNDSSNNINTYP